MHHKDIRHFQCIYNVRQQLKGWIYVLTFGNAGHL